MRLNDSCNILMANAVTQRFESGYYDDDSDDFVFTTLSAIRITYWITKPIGRAPDSGNTVTGDVEILVSTPSFST